MITDSSPYFLSPEQFKFFRCLLKHRGRPLYLASSSKPLIEYVLSKSINPIYAVKHLTNTLQSIGYTERNIEVYHLSEKTLRGHSTSLYFEFNLRTFKTNGEIETAIEKLYGLVDSLE